MHFLQSNGVHNVDTATFFSDRSFQAPQVASELMTTRIMALTDETFGSSDRSNHGLILDETRILGK